jgi:hypothetical protein
MKRVSVGVTKKAPPPTPDGREGRLFPPEQSCSSKQNKKLRVSLVDFGLQIANLPFGLGARESLRSASTGILHRHPQHQFSAVVRVVLNALADNAALPPDICAFGESVCHRLQEKQIHLRLSARVEHVVIEICVNSRNL